MLSTFPVIEPISDSATRPFWSVMVPVYNPGKYLESTLLSVISQDPGTERMQIEIVDDCSTANNAQHIIEKLGLRDRVKYYRQTRNVGLAWNWNTCIRRARGEVVHILHQDDFVLPGFYREIERGFSSDQSVGAAFCRWQILHESIQALDGSALLQTASGPLSGWLDLIATKNRIQTPSIAVRRSVYEKLGGYYPGLYYALDWEMWVRIANAYAVWYVPQTLATYRSHGESETVNLGASARTIRDISHSFVVRRSYLPRDFNSRTERVARRNYARFAFRHASSKFDGHHWHNGLMFLIEGLRCGRDVTTFVELVKMMVASINKRIWGHTRNLANRLIV